MRLASWADRKLRRAAVLQEGFQHYYARDDSDFEAAMAELRGALLDAGLRPPPKPGAAKAKAS